MNARRAASAIAGTLAAGAVATPVAAHAVGGVYQLPVPLWLYLAGAAAAVAASFAVLAARRRTERAARSSAPIPARSRKVTRVLLAVAGAVWWYGAIVVGFVVGDISPLPAVLLWVGIWIGLPIVSALLGNPWRAMSPFRTTHAVISGALGGNRAPPLRYPTELARWPAVAALAGAVWAELILAGGDQATVVAVLMSLYTVITLSGMLAFGASRWGPRAELFEVLLGWYGRIGAIRGGRIGPWFAGFRSLRGLGASDAAFVVLVLAGVTYDGLRETALGAAMLGLILPPVQSALGLTATTFLLVDTVGLAAVYAAFLAAFGAALLLTRAITAGSMPSSAAQAAGVAAAALVPIAAGYLVAHYLTLVIQALIWLPALVVDPVMSLAPDVDWIPIGLVWYVSVIAIVAGHVAAVAIAHRHVDRGRRGVLSSLPMVALMLGYTVLSLWIIAQPIVVEPGRTPGEARPLNERGL
jgi:hypothetical protein